MTSLLYKVNEDHCLNYSGVTYRCGKHSVNTLSKVLFIEEENEEGSVQLSFVLVLASLH